MIAIERHTRQFSAEHPPIGSILWSAAACPDVADALSLLRTMLALSDASESDTLIEEFEWRRAGYQRRLALIADWFRAECFREADGLDDMVPGERPMTAVGTND